MLASWYTPDSRRLRWYFVKSREGEVREERD